MATKSPNSSTEKKAPEIPEVQVVGGKVPLETPARLKPLTRQPVASLAAATDTRPVILAALKVVYGWTDKTRLTRAEFLKKRDEWLSLSAREV